MGIVGRLLLFDSKYLVSRRSKGVAQPRHLPQQTFAALRVVQERQAATMKRQQEILGEHIRRSLANEEMLKLMRDEGRDVVRWSFLGKALAVFCALVGLASPDYDTALARVAHLAATRWANLCLIDLMGHGAELRRLKVTSAELPERPWAMASRLSLEDGDLVARVLREGAPVSGGGPHGLGDHALPADAGKSCCET